MAKVLTPARRARLGKLAAYLEGLPKRYRHFDMEDYTGLRRWDAKLVQYALHNGGVAACGTVACALGHGPAAGILLPPRLVRENGGGNYVNWDVYAQDFFVGSFWQKSSDASERLYRWMFGGEWKGVDNHHWGAAARIRYVLAHGAPPTDYDEKARRKWRALYTPYRIDAKAQADA